MPMRLLKTAAGRLTAYSTTVDGFVSGPMSQFDAVDWMIDRYSMSREDATSYVDDALIEATHESDPVRIDLQEMAVGYWPKDPAPSPSPSTPGITA